jgi:DNA polymerase-3 subunit alpha
MSWTPLHCHSHYSLLDGLSKATQIAERCVKLGYKSCAVTDHGNIAGTIDFTKALKDVCNCGHQKAIHDSGKKCRRKNCSCGEFKKAGLKPILGSELYLCAKDATVKEVSNRDCSHLVVLAKNSAGWKSLVKLTSFANLPEHIYYKRPRLSLDKLSQFTGGNLIAFSGHMGSDLANVIFGDNAKLAYKAKTYDEAKALVRDDWYEATAALAGKYQDIFGKENFFIEIQLIDQKNLPASIVVAKILRYVAKKLGILVVATADSHYPDKEDASDQRILLCSQFETTLGIVQKKIDSEDGDVGLGGFFKSNNYHIPSLEEMTVLHTEEELQCSMTIAEMCESYDILGKPKIPTFDCPAGLSPDEYFRQLCIQGWKNKIASVIPKENQKAYADRVKHELEVIKNAGLASYFLIVQDFCNWGRNQGWLLGPGRGSGAGCLVSDLVGITSVDPLEYALIFERFYNAGRNTADRISLPDIDTDVPIMKRAAYIEYIQKKYGKDRVAQMITFSRMQGRGAVKDVFRAHEACDYDTMNRITEHIPDEAEIADELQSMKEANGEASIIQWALENNADGLREWCFLNKQGELEGPFAKLFAQAIRLEGTKRSSGKHAAGVVISAEPLADLCPMVYDKSNDELMVGWEMGAAEGAGLVKFDILGVAVLDKIMGVQQLIEHGKILA